MLRRQIVLELYTILCYNKVETGKREKMERKNKMEKAIYFDMDGTIADLYSVKDWLMQLRAGEAAPYRAAAPLLKLQPLARRLNKLQRSGYKIGIVSWASKQATVKYMEEIDKAKREWLSIHLKSVEWDEIHIVEYGTPKETIVNYPNGILFDDEERNRKNWNGKAFKETEINEILKAIS